MATTKYNLKPLKRFLQTDTSPEGIAEKLNEAMYLLSQYSINDLEESGEGRGVGYYHSEVPNLISFLHFFTEAIEEIKLKRA
jgi:hypothetical protein